MKAGFVQYAPIFGEPEKNLEKLLSLLNETPSADLLVLPELCNSGYNFSSKEQALSLAEEASDSRFVAALHDFCARRNLYIATGFNEKEGDTLFNTALLVGPEGLIGKYRKIHLFLNEKDIFAPGNAGLPVFDTAAGKIAMLVCFDWVFPEVWRILALKGADVICHCSNLVLPGFAQKSVPTHALVNHVYVITANRIGTEKNLTFTGMSTIADPLGNVIYQASADKEELKVLDFDLNLARNKQMTPKNDLFADRRPDLYGEILTASE
ncbi:MAG: nitrilase [Candidatus Rifleibacteriota bacterium]